MDFLSADPINQLGEAAVGSAMLAAGYGVRQRPTWEIGPFIMSCTYVVYTYNYIYIIIYHYIYIDIMIYHDIS